MIKGLYIAASSMQVIKNELNTVTNNLANSNTTAFKTDATQQRSFPEVFIARLKNGKKEKVLGRLGTGVVGRETYTDFHQGKLKFTGNQLDIAIEGDGFFVVETPAGRRYTRDGSFTLNEEGQIITQQGYLLMGERGPIQTIAGQDVNIDGNGLFHMGDIRGDRLLVVGFPDRQVLTKEGDDLFSSQVATENPADNFKIQQGYLENSNVSIIKEMVKMIEANKNYQSNQKVISTIDNTLEKAVNSVGRTR